MRKSLRVWRTERMLTQQGLAEMAGMKRRATIINIENGRQTVSLTTMQRIAEALCLEVRDVIEFADVLDRRGDRHQKRPRVET